MAQALAFANSVFTRLEGLPVPTLSAINGYALGGGCEFVMTTDFRIATPGAKIGLPKTKLGIIPGFGGTVKMPRLPGVGSALAIGLVDAVFPAKKLREAGINIPPEAIDGKQDWRTRRQPKLQPLKLSKTEVVMCFNVAKSMVLQTAGKHYPAPLSSR